MHSLTASKGSNTCLEPDAIHSPESSNVASQYLLCVPDDVTKCHWQIRRPNGVPKWAHVGRGNGVTNYAYHVRTWPQEDGDHVESSPWQQQVQNLSRHLRSFEGVCKQPPLVQIFDLRGHPGSTRNLAMLRLQKEKDHAFKNKQQNSNTRKQNNSQRSGSDCARNLKHHQQTTRSPYIVRSCMLMGTYRDKHVQVFKPNFQLSSSKHSCTNISDPLTTQWPVSTSWTGAPHYLRYLPWCGKIIRS